MSTVTVNINPDGSDVKLDLDGFKGSGCKDITKAINDVLGTVGEEKLKSEYYIHTNQNIKIGV